MTIIENIDLSNILNNLDSIAYKIKENDYAVFMNPDKFKEYGYNDLGFMINKTEDWLINADSRDIKDAVTANKIVRITRKTGIKWNMKVTTLLYMISSTFYNSKIGAFKC